jgi:hypothetical protein
MSELLETPSKRVLNNIEKGDYEDNEVVDIACARRLLNYCNDFGIEGQEAKDLLYMAFRKIDLYP